MSSYILCVSSREKDFATGYARAQGNNLCSSATSQGVNEVLPIDSVFVTNLIINNLVILR